MRIILDVRAERRKTQPSGPPHCHGRWAGIKNGELLKLVAADFAVFITSDKNLAHQQNLSVLDLSVILLPTNQVPAVNALLPQIDSALDKIGKHDFVEI